MSRFAEDLSEMIEATLVPILESALRFHESGVDWEDAIQMAWTGQIRMLKGADIREEVDWNLAGELGFGGISLGGGYSKSVSQSVRYSIEALFTNDGEQLSKLSPESAKSVLLALTDGEVS